MSRELICLDSTKEESYAIRSGENIKLRLVIGQDVYDRDLTIVGSSSGKNKITVYQNTKTFYKNGKTRGIGASTVTEVKDMGMVSTINGGLEKLLIKLRKNGYHIIFPKSTL